MNMIKCKLSDGVSPDDAIDSMKLRSNMLNFKLVGHMPLSEQVAAMGGKSNRMEIFQFCDAMIAAQMVKYSMAFAGYLPCRISLVVDDDDQGWLITLNMDKTMGDASLPKELQSLGLSVEAISDTGEIYKFGKDDEKARTPRMTTGLMSLASDTSQD